MANRNVRWPTPLWKPNNIMYTTDYHRNYGQHLQPAGILSRPFVKISPQGLGSKPNHINPFPAYLNTHQKNTPENNPADNRFSRDRVFSPYKVIPAIREEKHGNPIHGYTETCPKNENIMQHSDHTTQTIDRLDLNQLDNSAISHTYNNTSNHNTSNHNTPQTVTDREYLVHKFLPSKSYLSEEPLKLNKDDEMKLLRLVGKDLSTTDSKHLKDIYVDMTAYDRQLSGWAALSDLSFTFGKNHLFLHPDILRVLASQFVNTDHRGHVNYENVLSFIGTALKLHTNTGSVNEEVSSISRPESQMTDKPRYYVPPQQNTFDSPRDGETAKLLRLVENQLNDGTFTINFSKLLHDFQMTDRNHRETLSASQIKQVAYRNQLPLQESVINQILMKCETGGNGSSGGQYSWSKFIAFLERVQPSSTGLTLPQSKRPLEYAKHYMNPSSNWPRAESDSPGPLWKQQKETENHHYAQHNLTDTHVSPVSVSTQQSPRDQLPKSPIHREPAVMPNGRESVEKVRHIAKMENELHNLEKRYEVMKQTLEDETRESEPWFQRFLKMANAVYMQDINGDGVLPYEEVQRLLKLYNNAYSLRFTDHDLDKSLMENYDQGHVLIHPMLTLLGARRQ